MKKINIGVLGGANIAKRSVIPTINKMDEFELIAIGSRSKEKADSLANTFSCEGIDGYQGVLDRDDIDAVYIPLPTGLHKEWLKKSIEAGKHILCEKSLVENLKEAEEVIELAKQKNVLIMENFMFPFHSQQQYVRDLIDAGEIGEIRSFRSSFGFPPFKDKDNIRYQKDLGGGALLDAGAYPTKAAQMILGDDLYAASAHLKYDEATQVDLWGSAMLKSKSKSITAQLTFGFDHYYQCNYEIWGNLGKVTVHRSFTAGPGFSPKVTIEKQGVKIEQALKPDDHFANILHNFAETILKGDFEIKYKELLNQSRLLTEIRNHA